MEVIPVIDLKNGKVVRGIAGRRSEYRPLGCALSNSAEPADVAQALVTKYDFRRVYVADLDAIGGAEPNWTAYEAITAAGLRLWIDAGICDVPAAVALAKRAESVIVGLESLRSPHLLGPLVAATGPERVIFSLDLMQGRPITTVGSWQSLSPREIAAKAMSAGLRRIIVLDLAAVGVGQGPVIFNLGKELIEGWPFVRWIGGGGVRDAADLAALVASGFSAALVGSAIYDERLSRDDVRQLVRGRGVIGH
jgi:phosphoribosylformimino-5-aminoimidazole carboxamide ribotide isomerase